MDKTVESYRMALESEISRRGGFAKVLRKPDREVFDEELVFSKSIHYIIKKRIEYFLCFSFK